HFHFPSVEKSYLDQLKQALDENGVTLENILIDDGDIANLDDEVRQADVEMAKRWQQITAYLGGKGNRVDCGRERPFPTTINHTVNALKALTQHADSLGIRVVIENFHQMSREPETLIDIMQKVERPIGVCVDYGNAEQSADKFGTIEKLMPLATSIHCKANYVDGEIDSADLHQSLSYIQDAQFDGPITLIINETENEWDELLKLRTAVSDYLVESS
ncbi:MAG: TIM barrel protein, partial [Chloroflexota bacterium]